MRTASINRILVFLLAVGLASAAAKKPAPPRWAWGTIKKIDAGQGLFILTIKNFKGEKEDLKVRIDDDTRFVALLSKGKQLRTTGKAGLESRPFQKGAHVQIEKDDQGKVTTVRSGFFVPRADLPQSTIPRPIAGIVTKIDAERATMTLTTRENKEEIQVRLGKEARFILIDPNGRQKKYGRSKGFKLLKLKKGSQVAIFYGADGRPKAVMTAAPDPKLSKPVKSR
jgi:23S rRNA pseudoU1915 N3-methylase RlmH